MGEPVQIQSNYDVSFSTLSWSTLFRVTCEWRLPENLSDNLSWRQLSYTSELISTTHMAIMVMKVFDSFANNQCLWMVLLSTKFQKSVIYRQLRARRALIPFNDVLLRTRRALSLYKAYTTAKKKRPNQLGYLVVEFGYNQLHAMLSLWANWLQTKFPTK